MHRVGFSLLLLTTLGCSPTDDGPSQPPPEPAPIEPSAPTTVAVSWAEVEPAIAELICMYRLEIEGHGPIDEPVFGHREKACKLPPAATPLERAVERAYATASPILNGMMHAWREPVLAAMGTGTGAEQLAAVRKAYLSDRFLGLLLAHLEPELLAEDLHCSDCPPAFVPTPRTIGWDEFVPYLSAYVWPDPVVTPRNERGKPTGEPKYGYHICIGTNGISELPAPDPALVELGFLAAFHNAALRERVAVLFAALRTEDEFLGLPDDDDVRTKWLRARLGPRLAGEHEMRVAVCQTVELFEADTGLTIAECGEWVGRAVRAG
jgi:hypothetical protein